VKWIRELWTSFVLYIFTFLSLYLLFYTCILHYPVQKYGTYQERLIRVFHIFFNLLFFVLLYIFCLLLEGIMTEQASTSQSMNITDCKIPWPAYSEFFAFEPKLSTENNFAFTCKLCLWGKKIIHANKSSTANLKKHINVSLIFYLL